MRPVHFVLSGSAVYGQARIKFPPGAIIALYTDRTGRNAHTLL